MAGIPVAQDADPNAVPWGQMLPTKIEANLPPYPTEMKPKDGDWQVVNGTRFKFFVFSAFYDRRDGRMIRVIGATKTRGPEKVWCRMWLVSNIFYRLAHSGTVLKWTFVSGTLSMVTIQDLDQSL